MTNDESMALSELLFAYKRLVEDWQFKRFTDGHPGTTKEDAKELLWEGINEVFDPAQRAILDGTFDQSTVRALLLKTKGL